MAFNWELARVSKENAAPLIEAPSRRGGLCLHIMSVVNNEGYGAIAFIIWPCPSSVWEKDCMQIKDKTRDATYKANIAVLCISFKAVLTFGTCTDRNRNHKQCTVNQDNTMLEVQYFF